MSLSKTKFPDSMCFFHYKDDLICILCSNVFTCSTDKTLAMWDTEVCERARRYKGHTSFVNCCDVARRGPQLLCSGSDDGMIKVEYLRGIQSTHHVHIQQ